MHVGYVDERDRFFCPGCWNAEVNAGGHAVEVLDDQEDDPDDAHHFWVVDVCAACERSIQYKDVRPLA